MQGVAAVALGAGLAQTAAAQNVFAGPNTTGAAARDEDDTMAAPGQDSVAPIVPEPLRSWNGARSQLDDAGVSFAFTYLSDLMGTPGGGRKGASYMGRVEGVMDVDLAKAAGWRGATFHVGGFWIHGVGLSRHFIGNSSPVSDLEAAATARLNDIWIEQTFGSFAAVRIGRLAADSEFFFYTPSASLPIGGAFGWAPIMGQNLPNGGPAYPFAWPGARLQVRPFDHVLLQVGVFDGDAIGQGADDPSWRDSVGVRARRAPPFVIGEARVAYRLPFLGGVTGQARIGGWRHFGAFDDQRYDWTGDLLAAPNSDGIAARRRGDYGVYGALDQHVWRPADDPKKGVFVWSRIGIAPPGRNVIDLYLDGGVNVVGLTPGRPGDRFGLAASFSRASAGARAHDRDTAFFYGPQRPARDYEAILQATYSVAIAPGVAVQPNVQYIFHPGGTGGAYFPDIFGIRKPERALAFGVRTSIKY